MLHSVGELLESSVLGTDGATGRIVDAYFNARNLEIRYLMCEFPAANGCKELVFSASAVTGIDLVGRCLRIGSLPSRSPSAAALRGLRSSRQVLGCPVAGLGDGVVGQCADVIFGVDSWLLRFLMIDVSDVRAGAVVFIQPTLIEKDSWGERSLRIAVTPVEVLDLSEAAGCSTRDETVLARRTPRTLH